MKKTKVLDIRNIATRRNDEVDRFAVALKTDPDKAADEIGRNFVASGKNDAGGRYD